MDRFNELRARYDPKNILGNQLLDTCLGTPRRDPEAVAPLPAGAPAKQ